MKNKLENKLKSVLKKRRRSFGVSRKWARTSLRGTKSWTRTWTRARNLRRRISTLRTGNKNNRNLNPGRNELPELKEKELRQKGKDDKYKFMVNSYTKHLKENPPDN